MRTRVAVVYNQPYHSRYDAFGEEKAVLGVLEAVAAVYQALIELEFDVIQVPLVPPLAQAQKELENLRTDLVFNLFEGFSDNPETEAMVPEVLSDRGIPYTGCSGSVLRLSLDKARVKVVLAGAGIRTSPFQVLTPQTLPSFYLEYPCIVKPCSEDASHGVTAESVVSDFAALSRQVGVVSRSYGGRALVEEFVGGREFNATAMGNGECTVLPASEIVYSSPPGMPRVLTFDAKWEPDSQYFLWTKPTCPADIGPKEQQDIIDTTIATFRLICGTGYARVDMRMDDEGRINVIEVNPNPDISPGTGAARQAAASGMSYTRFIANIVELALGKKLPWTSASVL